MNLGVLVIPMIALAVFPVSRAGPPPDQPGQQPEPAGLETRDMPIDVKLTIAETDLLVQQNPVCRITFKNTGDKPVQVASPMVNPSMPILRVTEVKSGAERLRQRPQHLLGEKLQPLAPGQVLESEFPLLSIAGELTIGEYQVSAILVYNNGLDRAESNSVKLKVGPVSPRALSLVAAHGGWSAGNFGVCVNVAADPPQLVRYTLGVMSDGGVQDVRTVAPAPAGLRVAPVASVTPNRIVSRAQWIGWIDDGALSALHYDEMLGASGVGKLTLANAECQIVAPLFSRPPVDAGRPGGACMLYTRDPQGTNGAFQIVEISPAGKLSLGAKGACPGGRPTWALNHFRNDGSRLVTFTQTLDKGFGLFTMPWPDQALASNPLKKVATFDGAPVGSGGLVAEDNTVLGATLALVQQPGAHRLEMIRWSIDPKGAYCEVAREDVAWPYLRPISRAVVRVGPGGFAAALLADDKGQWSSYDGMGKVAALPAGSVAVSLDLAFLAEARPVLVMGRPFQGLVLLQPDGSELPHECD